LEENKNIFDEYDWWYFSKLDETLDRIYIPYYDNNLRKARGSNLTLYFGLKKAISI